MSDLVGNPEDRFSHNEAHMLYVVMLILSVYTVTAQKCILSIMGGKRHRTLYNLHFSDGTRKFI